MISKLQACLYSFLLILITAIATKYFVDTGLIPFYDILEKPIITPEKQYFVYIWNTIYVLLFIGYYLALTTKQSQDTFFDICSLFVVQLFLQILWSYSFFYLQQMWTPAIIIILLDFVVAMVLHTLFYVNKISFFLILPYFIWLLFATFLNIYIVFLN